MTNLIKIPVFDLKGTPLEAWKINGESFGKANSTLLAQAIRVYTSNSHQKTSKVKTRGEVDGSTRKIYRQKGTGNARHGAKYAPIFVGGGIAHGPTGVRPKNMILPKSMRRAALGAALNAKAVEQTIAGISKLKTFSGKTTAVLKLLALATKHPKSSVLVVTEGRATPLYQSLQNLQGVTMKRSSLVNAFDLVSSDYLILTKKALDSLLTRISL
ncbi:MAG: 50S ribosomal protein L4 [uncultured bacterium]|nr:MAG: 50S ribosomal protein L4 [uncultured bacterium]KKU15117.1 MAG: 50S ribosomal protein L4 [Microgenomates group bacterium GW2011_GWC2_45_8]KKU26323.1 MAG: 50S ribosomal protein L4 [Microgenomates group bacterium GW2011_GWA2_46_16]